MNLWLPFVASVVFSRGTLATTNDTREYCKWDPFEPKCRADEAIIVLAARYGRMRLGRCVRQDHGELGCHADVTELMDEACSGRQACRVVVPNPDLDRLKTCSDELTSYLEASYTCKKVIQGDPGRCRSNAPFPVASSDGILLSRITYETGCGSISSPWLLRAEVGQRFNISVWNFDRKQTNRYSKSCLKLALISDGVSGDSEPHVACIPPQARHQNLLVSERHEVLVRLAPFTGHQHSKLPHDFIFEFHAVGCADMRLPGTGAWTKRVGDVTSVGCQGDDEVRWSAECVEKKWVGNVGRCDAVRTNYTLSRSDNLKLTSVMSFAIIISISFLIGLFVLIGGLFWMQRKRRITRGRSSLQETAACFNKSGEDASMTRNATAHGVVELYGKKKQLQQPQPHQPHQQQQQVVVATRALPPSFAVPFSSSTDHGIEASYPPLDSVDLLNHSALSPPSCAIHSSEDFDRILCRYHCRLDEVLASRGNEMRLVKFKGSRRSNDTDDYDSINDSSRTNDQSQHHHHYHRHHHHPQQQQLQQQQLQQQQQQQQSNDKAVDTEQPSKDEEGCILMTTFAEFQSKPAELEIFRQHM